MNTDGPGPQGPSESLCLLAQTSPFGKGGLTISLRRIQPLTSVCFAALEKLGIRNEKLGMKVAAHELGSAAF